MGETRRHRARVKVINRRQMIMRTTDVESLVGAEHPVRAIWEFVGQMKLEGYYEEIEAVEGEAGRPALDPRLMISLWLYAYSEGVNSAREIGRRCGTDPAYQWLTGMEEVNYHSLSDFRVKHGEKLQTLFIQSLGMLTMEGLVTLQRVMHDGTKVKACASGGSFRREKRIRQYLKKAREHVEALESVSEEEMTARELKAKQRGARERLARMESALKKLDLVREEMARGRDPEEARVSVSDPDARIMKQSDGGYAPSYNVQISTDADASIIVGVGVVQSGSDQGQLPEAVERIEEMAGGVPKQMVVDGGFTTGDTIEAMNDRGVDLIGSFQEEKKTSSGQFERRGVAPEFHPERFVYEPTGDSYRCPVGKTLKYLRKERQGGRVRYVYRAATSDCQACPHKQQCCPGSTQGRMIKRTELTEAVAAFQAKMVTEEAKAIYRQRSQVAEFPIAWIKAKFGLRQFRLRGLLKVMTEVMWACLTYNIQQWIRLCWRQRLQLQKA